MELLPCPFCASTSAKGHVREYTGTGLYTIICPECRAEGPAHIGKFVARDVMEVLCPGADSYDRDARRHSPGIAAAGELWNSRKSR